MQTTEGKRVLITGSAGRLGRVLVDAFRERYRLRGFDKLPTPGLEDAVVGDVADFDAVRAAAEGMHAVVHLGAVAVPGSPWEEVLPANIIGTYNVFEAAHRAGARRIVFASRADLVQAYDERIKRTVDLLPLPGSLYSVSKIFGEAIGAFYARQRSLEVVVLRIGECNERTNRASHPIHLSPADAVHLFGRALEQPGVQYQIAYGVSDSSFPMFDLESGRKTLGFRPRDRSEWSPSTIRRAWRKLWRR